jgi:hypothetical protein
MAIWLACDGNNNCRKTNQDPRGAKSGTNPVNITNSVGAGGANLRADVVEVQQGLNGVAATQGGASPSLDVDGLCGPLTVRAIRRFQIVQFPDRTPDGRVDPGQRTIQRLNDILLGALVLDTTDLTGVELAYLSVPDALTRVRRAIARLFNVKASYLFVAPLTGQDLERRSVEWHFKVNKADDPVAQIARVLRVYDRMRLALEGATLSRLFQTGRGDIDYVAMAEFGGYDFAVDELATDKEPGAYVYIHPEKRARSLVIIHELGHFCGGRRGSGSEIEHMAHPVPWPNGKAIDCPRNYMNMNPDDAFRNTYSYQAYAFPEQSFGKIPGKF